MRHASAGALDQLDELLGQIRLFPGLVERNVRLADDFERYRVETAEERAALIRQVQLATADT